jgi:hypothetical protein
MILMEFGKWDWSGYGDRTRTIFAFIGKVFTGKVILFWKVVYIESEFLEK